MACITSSIDLLYLIKTSEYRRILFIKEDLVLPIFPFCFNIRVNNCLQLRERSSILWVDLEILRNFAPMLPYSIFLVTLVTIIYLYNYDVLSWIKIQNK